MKKIDSKLLIFELIRYALIILFLYTAYHKLTDIDGFEKNILRSKIISEYADFIKYPLPVIEILVVLLLFFNKYLLYGLYASLFLMASFTIYLIALNNFSMFYGCSCGGIFNEMSYVNHVMINFATIALNILAIFLFEDKYKQ
ncbi:fatty acid desaturase [Chryseobacterium sediminis]|uniref:Fatty acid desaturase n=1 Tax=Chryseobacterium sediminis TaxID=1679494 RepID=A0ABR6PVN2_9FLAO|nr:fatty acid desaturase [Chryseobacterium sediminis]